MLLGYQIRKRSMAAYDKVIAPELKGCQIFQEGQPEAVSKTKRPVKSVLRAAACIVLALILIGLVAPNNSDNTGISNSFVLTAYAASDTVNPNGGNNFSIGLQRYNMSTGVTMEKNTEITLPVMKIYIAKDADGNNYGSSSDDFSIFKGRNIDESSKHAEYSSGFQFSGESIESITMTSLNGRFTAYDHSVVNPIYQKYAKIVDVGNGFATSVIDEKDFSDSDKAFIDSQIKSGQTVTFPPAGYTVNWGCAINNSEKTSDTIEITVKYSDSSTQTGVLTVSENDSGNIVAVLN